MTLVYAQLQILYIWSLHDISGPKNLARYSDNVARIPTNDSSRQPMWRISALDNDAKHSDRPISFRSLADSLINVLQGS